MTIGKVAVDRKILLVIMSSGYMIMMIWKKSCLGGVKVMIQDRGNRIKLLN